MREYVRDKRSPKPKNEKVSEVMSANKAKNTKPELALRKLLWQEGLRGYRVNYRGVPGRPDVAFTARKVAVFVNGCFWHRCPHCNYSLPKNNTAFWEKKFSANVARDKRKIDELKALGWKTYTVWECELGNEKAMKKLLKQLGKK
jgi:DNA mismatch endonuclease (patch repair protein)